MRFFFILFLPAVFAFNRASAQQNTTPDVQSKKQKADRLFLEVAKADSLVFAAFNSCDTISYRKFFKDDLEFYHDLGGLTVGIENEINQRNV